MGNACRHALGRVPPRRGTLCVAAQTAQLMARPWLGCPSHRGERWQGRLLPYCGRSRNRPISNCAWRARGQRGGAHTRDTSCALGAESPWRPPAHAPGAEDASLRSNQAAAWRLPHRCAGHGRRDAQSVRRMNGGPRTRTPAIPSPAEGLDAPLPGASHSSGARLRVQSVAPHRGSRVESTEGGQPGARVARDRTNLHSHWGERRHGLRAQVHVSY